MRCTECLEEYESNTPTCPRCGRTIVKGASSAARSVEEPYTGPGLSTTISVSGSASIRSRLRPRSITEIISESFALYAANWKLFAAIVLIFHLPTMVFVVLCGFGPRTAGPATPEVSVFAGLAGLTSAVATLLTYFALTRAVSNSYLGRPVSLGDTLAPNKRFWGFFGSMLLVGLVCFGVVMVLAFLPAFGLAASVGQPGSYGPPIAGMLCAAAIGIPAFLACYTVTILSGPAAVIEGQGAMASLNRSAILMRGFFWKGVGLVCLVMLIGIGVGVGVAALAGLAGLFSSIIGIPGLINLLSGLIQVGGEVITTPLYLLPIILFYYDLRIRKEAFDLQMLAEQLGYGVESPTA